jgi:hypothetical protein
MNVLTRHYENVPILVPVVCPMTGGAVADGEARGLVTNQLKHQLIFITHIRKHNYLRGNQKPLYSQVKIQSAPFNLSGLSLIIAASL